MLARGGAGFLKTLRGDLPFMRRETIAIAGLLLAGVLIGLGVARLVSSEPRISTADYSVLVSDLYQRDHSLTNARDRLDEVGISDPGAQLAGFAQTRVPTPEAVQEARSLRELATALGAPTPPSTALPKTTTVPSTTTAAVPAPASQGVTEGGGGGQFYLIPLLVFALALGFGALFAIRILGLKPADFRRVVPSIHLPGNGRHQVGAHRPVFPSRGSAVIIRRNPILEGRTGAQGGGGSRGGLGQRPQAATATRNQFSFQSTYQLGDDPYDEIHPIVDRSTGVLMGACGLSASLKLDDPGPTRYYAFTAWVHDYMSNEQLKSLGLVSRWGYASAGEEIDNWMQGGLVDELKQVERGAIARLETRNLAANLSIVDFEYGDDGPSQGYFARLTTRFDVSLKPRTKGEE